MEWKQPEGLRRHWMLEELDAEILFVPMPVDGAQGRVDDDVFDLRDGGVLRKRRTILREGETVATLEERDGGAGGTLTMGERRYQWKPTSPLGTRWTLAQEGGEPVFTLAMKPGLGKTARLELHAPEAEGLSPLLLLCWYATVLS